VCSIVFGFWTLLCKYTKIIKEGERIHGYYEKAKGRVKPS
jgi:hypothetical protein